MISLSVDSGQPGKYSCEVPHEHLEGSGNLSGKIKRNGQSNLVSFFEKAISLLAYVATFSGLYFGRSYFFTLFWSNYFYTTVTFSQELFFQNSFFFGGEILQSSHFLRIESSLRQLLFGAAIFFGGTVQDKDIEKKLLFQRRYFCTASTISEKVCFRKN